MQIARIDTEIAAHNDAKIKNFENWFLTTEKRDSSISIFKKFRMHKNTNNHVAVDVDVVFAIAYETNDSHLLFWYDRRA